MLSTLARISMADYKKNQQLAEKITELAETSKGLLEHLNPVQYGALDKSKDGSHRLNWVLKDMLGFEMAVSRG